MMGYEIWDRYVGALIDDLDNQDAALNYLRELVRAMNVETAARQLDRMQLVRVSNAGTATEVISAGVDLLSLIFAPTGTHAH